MQNYFDNEATSSALHATMKPARGGKCLVTLSTYEDRKEALLNTTILDDAGTSRSKGPKINSLSEARQQQQQNDTLDNRGPTPDTYSHIPKAPPLQMTNNNNSNNNTYKTNNNTQTTNAAANTSKTFAMTEQISGSQTQNNGNIYNGNDTYSRPNKTPSSNNANNQANRHTLRLGTVTIGEYRQQTSQRREPEKFDFLSSQRKDRDSGDTTPTNKVLQSELQSTLSRANLRKSNGSSYTEHQRNCPLHQQQQQQLQQRHSVDYDNNGGNYMVEEMSKKLQKSSLNGSNSGELLLAKTNNRAANNVTGTTGVGILKNGNRNGNSSSSSSKSTEKSIKFG